MEWQSGRFHPCTQNGGVHNLTFMICLFLEFSISYFHTVVDCRQPKPHEEKLGIYVWDLTGDHLQSEKQAFLLFSH